MDKSEIVVGGIYECTKFGSPLEATVIDLHRDLDDDFDLRELSVDHVYASVVLPSKATTRLALHCENLTRKIGYDATYSAEYKQARAELKRLIGLSHCCDEIKSNPEFTDNPSVFYELLKEYQTQLAYKIVAVDLECKNIKAQSKGVSDAI